MKQNCDVFVSLAVVVFSLQKIYHQLVLNRTQEKCIMNSAQKSESETDIVECSGVGNNVILSDGNIHAIESSPVKKGAETILVSGSKRCSAQMGEMSTGPLTSGGSSGTDSSPAKKRMEAMKNKCPNAGLTNQVVNIASLFLGHPSCKIAARLVLIVVKEVFFGGRLQQIMELTFLDRSGEIKVTVWSNLVGKWLGVLKANDAYLLTGLVFFKADSKYTRTSPGVVEAKFNNYTQCTLISESDVALHNIPRLQFNFKDFNSLSTESKFGDVIDVIGLLTEVCDFDFSEKGNGKSLILMNRDTEQMVIHDAERIKHQILLLKKKLIANSAIVAIKGIKVIRAVENFPLTCSFFSDSILMVDDDEIKSCSEYLKVEEWIRELND